MTTYSVIVTNRQGASDGITVTSKAAAQRYLDTWSDPEALQVYVTDPFSPFEEVGHKDFGRKRIRWTS